MKICTPYVRIDVGTGSKRVEDAVKWLGIKRED